MIFTFSDLSHVIFSVRNPLLGFIDFAFSFVYHFLYSVNVVVLVIYLLLLKPDSDALLLCESCFLHGVFILKYSADL